MRVKRVKRVIYFKDIQKREERERGGILYKGRRSLPQFTRITLTAYSPKGLQE